MIHLNFSILDYLFYKIKEREFWKTFCCSVNSEHPEKVAKREAWSTLYIFKFRMECKRTMVYDICLSNAPLDNFHLKMHDLTIHKNLVNWNCHKDGDFIQWKNRLIRHLMLGRLSTKVSFFWDHSQDMSSSGFLSKNKPLIAWHSWSTY